MKIVIRGGHNYGVQGANGIVNEVAEDRNIYPEAIKWLKIDGNEVLDVTPDRTSTSAQDLTYGVSKANEWGADYFASIHLNASNGNAQGTECLYQSEKGRIVAQRIADKISSLGFKNRGAKPNTRGLYELKHTNMVANIIEVFFCDSQVDVDLYNSIGVETIGKAIAEGIVGHDIAIQVEESKPIEQPQPVQEESPIEKAKRYVGDRCRELQEKLTKVGYDCHGIDGIFGKNTYNALITFQRDRGLSVDGLAGSKTFSELDSIIEEMNRPKVKINQRVLAYQKAFNKMGLGTIDEDGIIGNETLNSISKLPLIKLGSYNAMVGFVQMVVGTSADNRFGNLTLSHVKSYQSNRGLTPDGKVGKQTIKTMLTE